MLETQIENDGKISAIKYNSKPVPKSQMNAFAKAQELPYFRRYTKLEPYIVQNPFSGEEVELNAMEMTIYQFCLAWYSRWVSGGIRLALAPVKVYDDVRYLLLTINSDAYMKLID